MAVTEAHATENFYTNEEKMNGRLFTKRGAIYEKVTAPLL